MLMGFFLVSQVKATTDTPLARIQISWKRRGVVHNESFTLEELLSCLSETTTGERTRPQGDYTDIADLP
ncbi:hypothetical protein LCGC14_0829260 [marine sediment metagenome]|uniref:Uncharacterized protein n=1 Tax=marine sediment metagenome TaxID=412755 RepID=A0A0F9PGI8_9ZZZZ